ncbi:MAG: hypothetical protein AW08_00839 [Candidatus Accumulibacter adjunctus]|uniref:Uncharacterized protein n=1 Tax=Candidatus Accumulibacter adjunctus TaxID=1454001 RepID=A0A011MGP4_9PROT|nr:MAG: hypothetical protein AW08_00839 [Candidatus Accumulibacter adjunctus]
MFACAFQLDKGQSLRALPARLYGRMQRPPAYGE